MMGMFKVGDRVALNTPWWDGVEVPYTIVASYNAYEIASDGSPPFCVAESELIAPQQQLTIREGGYYRTRDGRKVGPMRDAADGWFSEDDDVDGRLWDVNGHRYSIGNNHDTLIAEWPTYNANPAAEVDNLRDEYEPVGTAANDSATGGSTAGFTVPVFEDDDAPIRYKDGRFIVNATDFMPPVAEATSGKGDDEPDTKLLVSISADTSALDAEIDRVLKRLRKLKRKARKLGISLEYSELRDAA